MLSPLSPRSLWLFSMMLCTSSARHPDNARRDNAGKALLSHLDETLGELDESLRDDQGLDQGVAALGRALKTNRDCRGSCKHGDISGDFTNLGQGACQGTAKAYEYKLENGKNIYGSVTSRCGTGTRCCGVEGGCIKACCSGATSLAANCARWCEEDDNCSGFFVDPFRGGVCKKYWSHDGSGYVSAARGRPSGGNQDGYQGGIMSFFKYDNCYQKKSKAPSAETLQEMRDELARQTIEFMKQMGKAMDKAISPWR